MTAAQLTIEQIRAMTLPQLLRQRARSTPNAVALRHKELGIWVEITWAQYYAAARRFALALHLAGIGRGDRIAIASEGTPQWFYADLGAQMLGVEVVGIYPTNPWNELQYIVRHSRARAVVCGDQEQTDKVIDAREKEGGLPDLELVVAVDTKGMRHYQHDGLTSFEDFLAAGARHDGVESDPEAWLDAEIDRTSIESVCILVYTSGTTGRPKGAMLSHRNLTYSTSAFAEASGMLATPFSAICYLPLCHVAERCYSMVQHLILGGTVSFAESVETVASNIREIGPSFFLGVPRIWEKLREDLLFRSRERQNIWRRPFALALSRADALFEKRVAKGGRLSPAGRLEALFWRLMFFRNVQAFMGLDRTAVRVCGGGAVSEETLRFFDMLGLPICQAFGLTESTGMAFSQRPGKGRVGTCGLPLPGTEYRLGEDGEILIRSPAVVEGYLFDPEATSANMDENALRDSPYIREAIVVGDARKFVGALIQIDFDTVGRWASENDIAYTTYKSLALNDRVRGLIGEVVDRVNTRFARVENVRRFVILEKELDHDDGELTATQKIRRSIIETKFEREMAMIYGPEDAHAVRA